MAEHAVQSDKGIGFAVLFSLVALGGAGMMFAAPGQLTKAWGFALAMTAAAIAIVGTHVYWG